MKENKYAAGKVTVRLALHWPGVDYLTGLSINGLAAQRVLSRLQQQLVSDPTRKAASRELHMSTVETAKSLAPSAVAVRRRTCVCVYK